MSAPRPNKTVTHATAKKPKAPVPVVAHRPPAPVAAGVASARPEAAWAGAPAAAFGIAGPVGIQLKPVIGAADDAYEQEADKVAEQVVSGPTAAPPRITPVTPSALRRPVQRAPRDEDADQPVQRATAGDPTHRGEEEARSRSTIPTALVQRATAGDRTDHDDPPLEGVQGAEGKVQRATGDSATRAGRRIARDDGGPEMQDAAARAIARRGAGAPIVPGVRAMIEARLGVDLGHVRVHTDEEARRATGALGARAFTHGSDIWLARGESPADTRLVAHEATHVVQQGAAEPRIHAATPSASPSAPTAETHAAATASATSTETSNATSSATSTAAHGATSTATPAATHGAARASAGASASTSARSASTSARSSATRAGGAAGTVQRWIPQTILDGLNDYAEYIPGWTLFTVIIGFNPLTGRDVPRSAHNLVHGFLELVPFGAALYDKLNEHGVIGAAVDWVTGELGRLNLSLARLERTIEAAGRDVSILEGLDYNIAVLRRHFTPLYDDVVRFAGSIVDKVVSLIKEAAIGVAEGFLAENRAWALLKKILGRDPLRDVQVQATPAEILADFLTLIGSEEHLRQMRERGTLEETANWLAQQLATFTGLLEELTSLFGRAWDAIQPSNIGNLGASLRSLATDAGAFLQRVWDFATTVAAKVLELVKKALLGWLATFANDVPGFHLVTVIIGKNPFTDEPVPRTPTNLIRGFITLLPNGAAIYARLQETGTVERVAGRIQAAMESLGISWAFVKGIFTGIWNDLSIEDLVNPVDAFNRIVARYAEPVSRLFGFVNVVIREMVSIILEIMNFPSDLVGSIVANAMAAIEDVKRDPIGFFRNMMAAVKRGFGSFFDHILTHLAGGLADWLFRGLRQAGIEPPRDLSLRSVLDFVLQVLGISIDRIWQKLAARIGPERVARIRGAIDRLTGIWTFVKDVQERGVAAIWEHIESQISNLWEMVVQKARDWIMERVINRAMVWLMSLLDVTGIMPVINGFMAFFRAIQSAIDYLRDILAIVNDYVATLAAVARGDVDPGAQKIEGGLARSIPVAIGFLANQFGLGNIGEKIQEIVGGIRETVDRALDWLVDRAVATGTRMFDTLMGTAEQSPAERLQNGMRDAVAVVNRYSGRPVGRLILTPLLGAIRVRYRLATLDVVQEGDRWAVEGTVNPRAKRVTGALASGTATTAPPLAVGDRIQVISARKVRADVYVVTRIDGSLAYYEPVPTEEGFQSTSRRVTVGAVSLTREGRDWARARTERAIRSDAWIQRENQKTGWNTFEDAKRVLNYRHHGAQNVPPNKSWEHIIEQAYRGIHTEENLALADDTLNEQKLNAWMGDSLSSHSYPDLGHFPSTGPLSVREYLRSTGADGDEWGRWKRRAYKVFRVALRWYNHGRGRYQKLE